MDNHRTIEISLKRVDDSGRRKLFAENMEDLREQMKRELKKRDLGSQNFILFSIKGNSKRGLDPILPTYKIVDRIKTEAEERK